MPTGGNTEPLGLRKFGVPVPPDNENENGALAVVPPAVAVVESPSSSREKERETKRKHKKKSRSRSPEHKRDRDRDRESRKKSSKRRSRSRERRDRDRSRDRGRSRSRGRDRDHEDRKSKRSRFDLKEASDVFGPTAPPTVVTGGRPAPGVPPPVPAPPTQHAVPGAQSGTGTTPEAGGEKKRQRKSRWSVEKSYVPGMPTMLPSNLTDDQAKGYLLQLQIEDASRKLRAGDLGIHPDPAQRSPSPEPVYDTHGKRLNTREVRTRHKLEQLRHNLIQELLKMNPNYKPPPDYKAPIIKLHDKVWIPQDDHPEVNFVGLLIGPRGNTLKSLERETNAKIIIRGKGSVKEGKILRPDRGPLPGEDEPLHAYITATDPDIIKKAAEKIHEIIQQALEIPENQNELRKLQLRELAVLNGTLRPEDFLSGARCSNCGANTHKSWECPDAPNVTANIICTACGAAGHIAKDCKNPRPGGFLPGAAGPGGGLDEEYSALMAELGQETDGDPGMAHGLFGGGPRPKAPLAGGLSGRGSLLGGGPRGGEPIVRINLAASNRPKPQSLMNMDVCSPQMGGGGGMPPPPPWGWPPVPPGMMPPPPMGSDGLEGSNQTPIGYPMMGGMAPPPPPSNSADTSSSDGGKPNPMMPPMMWPPSMQWGMPMPVPPPPGSGNQPPPPPPPMDLSALLTAPAPPPPPPE